MYQEFYGLRDLPFELTANPKYLYLTPRHLEALSNLQYGLAAGKSVTVLVGEAGTGKTTLLKAAMVSDRCRHVHCVCLSNPALTRSEFIEILARSFSLGAQAARSKAVLLEDLENALIERKYRGEPSALVVDEAQSLSTELLEEIRLLANMETNAEKLLPLVLVGQPALGMRLEASGLRQLKQRVALRCEITAFDLSETAEYIASRIRTAGGMASRLFTRDAVRLIHENSGGIPRTVNVICDNALIHGLALDRRPVDRQMVLDVCQDFRLGDRLAQSPSGPRVREAIDAASELDAGHGASDSEQRGSDQPRFRLFGVRRR
jgi:general secretion pathway protein A